MSSALSDKYELLDAALESARVPQDRYAELRRALRLNAIDERQADGLLLWLDLHEKWTDAELAMPDAILEELREQLELDCAIRDGWVKKLDNEILKGLWEAAQLSYKLHEKFYSEYEREMTAVEHATMCTMFIEQNKRNQPARTGGGNGGGGGGKSWGNKPSGPKCDVCGGAQWDNRTKKMDDPQNWGNAPDFTCKDKDCSSRKKKRAAAPAGDPLS